MEAQLLDIDMEAYHQDYNNPFTGYSKADYNHCQVEAKQMLYKEQYQEFNRLIEDLWLAYLVAKKINIEEGLYYLQMYTWILYRYDYLNKYCSYGSTSFSTPF